MSQTIYASFPDTETAEKATGALMDHGANGQDISLIAKEVREDRTGATMYEPPLGEVDPAYADRIVDDPDLTYKDAAVAADYNTAVIERDYDADRKDDDDLGAKSGLSTTTGADAASGAAKGAGIGLGVGVLASLAALAIPGFGLVVGGGALAAALAGTAGATAAGAVAGGVTGYLKDQGLPEHVATNYGEAFDRGGAILAVTLPSGDLDITKAESVLAKYGATNVGSYDAALR